MIAALEATNHALEAFDSAQAGEILPLLTSAKNNLENAWKSSDWQAEARGQQSYTMPSASCSDTQCDIKTFDLFKFFPAEIRLRVYRELLVSPVEIDPVYGRDAMRLHPAILRVGKEIHNEADRVLYGENVFAVTIFNGHISKLWHRNTSRTTLMPRASSRKIDRVHLYVNTTNPDPKYRGKLGLITVNAGLIAKKLSLNNLKLLRITFLHTDSIVRPYESLIEVENCMEPLCLIRAAKVVLLHLLIRIGIDS